MQKDNALFLISMSNSMKKLWPAPIEMNLLDEGFLRSRGQKTALINASRWAVCSDIIRLMLKRKSGFSVDVSIVKYSKSEISVANGNTEEEIQTLLTLLDDVSKTTIGNEETNVEPAIREIEKISTDTRFIDKNVHWFMDVDEFSSLNPLLIDRVFPSKLVTLYVIGELQTLHDNYSSAKRNTVLIGKHGAEVRFLVCRADLNELRSEILSEKRYEMREKKAKIHMGKERIPVKLFKKHRIGMPEWPIKVLFLVGFLSEIELCRIGFFVSKSLPEHQLSVSVDCQLGKTILWSMYDFMFHEVKNPRVALFKYRSGKKGTTRGYCIMVAHENESNGVNFTLIRLPEAFDEKLKYSLRYLHHIDEKNTPLPDKSCLPIAPEHFPFIKRRLTEIVSKGTPESKRAKYDLFANEYNITDGRDKFFEATAPWIKQNNLVKEETKKEE